MQQVVLATIQTYGTLSGYIYLHLPNHICKAFDIKPKTPFAIVYSDGRVIIRQEVSHAIFVGNSAAAPD